jgi:phosphohistidine phosphatase
MGKILAMAGLKPDIILASPAKRTRQTAKRIADATGCPEDRIIYVDSFYQGSPSTLEIEVSAAADAVQTIFVVSHNPGITEFAWQLDPAFRIGNMPTCAVVAAHVSSRNWAHFAAATKKVFLFKHP